MQAGAAAAAAMEMALALAEFSQRYKALKSVPTWQRQAENRLANDLRKVFDGVIDQAIGTLLEGAGMPADSGTRRKITQYIMDAADGMGEAIFEHGLRAADHGRQMTLADATQAYSDLKFDTFDKHTRDLIKQHAFTASQRTMNRMAGDVMGQLTDIYERGLGIDAGAEELRAVFDGMRDYELNRVARTEIQSFQNEGAHLTMEELGVEYEIWESIGDERTRGHDPKDKADHVWLDGCIVRTGDDFPNGLRHPGDRSGGEDTIHEWINCRCRSRPFFIPEGKMAPPGKPYFFEHELLPIHGPGEEDQPIITQEDRQQAAVQYAATLGVGAEGPHGPLLDRIHARADETHARYALSHGMTIEEYRAAANERIAELNSHAEIMSRVPNEDVLRQILEDGRLKSQFEVGSSKGYFDPDFRADAEYALFGAPQDLPDQERPVYGFLCDGSNKDDAIQYGGVVIRMDKEAVEARTTFTYDDSLGMRQVPQLLTSPSWEGAGYDVDVLTHNDLDTAARPYPEVQIHGGLSKDAFAEVIFTQDPSREMVDLLTKEGIPYSIDSKYDPYGHHRP